MSLSIRQLPDQDDVVAFVVIGDLDIRTAPEVKETLSSALRPGRRIVVSLSELKVVDSTGLGVLIGVMKRAKEMQGEVVLAEPPANIQRVLDITGLSRVFTVYPSVADAALAKRPAN